MKDSDFKFASFTEDNLGDLATKLGAMLETLLNNTEAKGQKAHCFVKGIHVMIVFDIRNL